MCVNTSIQGGDPALYSRPSAKYYFPSLMDDADSMAAVCELYRQHDEKKRWLESEDAQAERAATKTTEDEKKPSATSHNTSSGKPKKSHRNMLKRIFRVPNTASIRVNGCVWYGSVSYHISKQRFSWSMAPWYLLLSRITAWMKRCGLLSFFFGSLHYCRIPIRRDYLIRKTGGSAQPLHSQRAHLVNLY